MIARLNSPAEDLTIKHVKHDNLTLSLSKYVRLGGRGFDSPPTVPYQNVHGHNLL